MISYPTAATNVKNLNVFCLFVCLFLFFVLFCFVLFLFLFCFVLLCVHTSGEYVKSFKVVYHKFPKCITLVAAVG